MLISHKFARRRPLCFLYFFDARASRVCERGGGGVVNSPLSSSPSSPLLRGGEKGPAVVEVRSVVPRVRGVGGGGEEGGGICIHDFSPSSLLFFVPPLRPPQLTTFSHQKREEKRKESCPRRRSIAEASLAKRGQRHSLPPACSSSNYTACVVTLRNSNFFWEVDRRGSVKIFQEFWLKKRLSFSRNKSCENHASFVCCPASPRIGDTPFLVPPPPP